MKKLITILVLSLNLGAKAQSYTNTYNFNAITSLTTSFNNDGTPVLTNVASGGLGNSGMINIPLGSSDLWTTKQSFNLCDLLGDVYKIEGYFRTVSNSGYGGFGFATNSSNTCVGEGYATPGLGVTFHGGGGAFHSNGVTTYLDWFSTNGDLVANNWYKAVFSIQVVGANTYNLVLQIFNSDANGNVGSLFVQRNLNNVLNNNIGTAAGVYLYFSTVGVRMDKLDNLTITLTCAVPLPVELVDFDYDCSDEVPSLSWKTVSEKNLDYFEVQQSDDGVHFSTLQQINAAGNSENMLEYVTSVYAPLASILYYRLKMVDNDGREEYSDVISGTICLAQETLITSISQTDQEVQLTLSDPCSIVIIDALGKKVANNEILQSTLLLSKSGICAGVYLVCASNKLGFTQFRRVYIY